MTGHGVVLLCHESATKRVSRVLLIAKVFQKVIGHSRGLLLNAVLEGGGCEDGWGHPDDHLVGELLWSCPAG